MTLILVWQPLSVKFNFDRFYFAKFDVDPSFSSTVLAVLEGNQRSYRRWSKNQVRGQLFHSSILMMKSATLQMRWPPAMVLKRSSITAKTSAISWLTCRQVRYSN